MYVLCWYLLIFTCKHSFVKRTCSSAYVLPVKLQSVMIKLNACIYEALEGKWDGK